MTEAVWKKTKIPHPKAWETLVAGLLPVTLFLLFLKAPKIASHAAREGLRLCGEAVIPSLFPFAVLSGMMVGNGLIFALPTKITRPVGRLFQLSHHGVCLLLPCLLCGFPIGAVCMADTVAKGRLSREEGERMLLFCNLPSPAFCIGTLGAGFWGSTAIGGMLYGCALLSAILAGICIRPKKEPPSPLPLSRDDRASFAVLLTSSLSGGAQAMLSVSACVVFFTTVSEILRRILTVTGIPWQISSVADYLLELSGAACRGAAPGNISALLLCAFGVGWSGLSVHCQIQAVCQSRGITVKGYWTSKLCQGLLSALFMGLLCLFCPVI